MMIWWNFYFIAKTYMHLAGYIHAGFFWNLFFLIFLILPVPAAWPAHKALRTAKTATSIIAGFLILWGETWFPPILFMIKFLASPATRPSFSYMLEFLSNTISVNLFVALLALLVVALFAAKRRLRLTPLSFILLIVIAASAPPPRSASGIEEFYALEAKRNIILTDPAKGAPAFDIIIVHICSLSWDDLTEARFDMRPFLAKFDYVFSNFNSATSYSNPAAIRLLKAPCGQLPHNEVFQNSPDECYLMDALRKRGYTTSMLLNHDGKYDGYSEKLKRTAKVDDPFQIPGLQPEKLNFDDTPIFSDSEVLGYWWRSRLAGNPPAAAVYYNTISLHQGAHFSRAQVKNPWEQDRIARYSAFLKNFTNEIGQFFSVLETSGRNVVVILVSEHGAALKNTRMQAPDVRDIPLPQLTLVPAAIKIFGPGYGDKPANQRIIGKPVSYLALTHMLATLLNRPPYGQNAGYDAAMDIPETKLVSENENAKVLLAPSGFMYQQGENQWIDLPADVISTSAAAGYLSISK